MKKIILRLLEREDTLTTIGLTAVVLFVMTSWFWPSLEILITPPEQVSAATTSAVTVTASVEATISCSTDQSSSAFGALTSSVIATSTPNASSTISCANAASGCSLYVKDAGNAVNGGLATTSPAYLIRSPNAAGDATSTLVAGTEGYGIQAATTTTGAGAVLGVVARYLQTGNTVGRLDITNQTIASTTATSSNREVKITHKAAISSVTPAGSYSDTTTYECSAN